MDNLMLTAAVDEIRALTEGAAVGDVVQIDSRFFALRFSVPPFARVGIALHPEACSLCLLQRVATPRETTELASVLSAQIGGRLLGAVRKQAHERVVELEFGGDGAPPRTVVIELMGKASNLLLLDEERKILRFLTAHKGTFRRPEAGGLYEPPPPRPPAADEPFASRLLTREIAARVARGEPQDGASGALLERVSTARWDPVLYTPHPPETLAESAELTASTCFASPFPLLVGEGLVATSVEGPAEAAGRHLMLLRRHLLFRDLRSTIVSMLAGESRRLEKLDAILEGEADRAAGAGEIRRMGELLLASLATAVKNGDRAELTDYYDPELRRISLPIDPSLDLKANAEAIFRRARKMDRAVAAIAARRRDVSARREGARRFLEAARSARTTPELERIEAELNRSGVARKVRRPERREPGRRASLMKVKEYRTSDGHALLVGASAADNDTLTFKVAAPHDFWLHAAGRAGAHVIVRNPGRRKELPERTLQEAAAVAAWFSRGDRGCDVEVHVTKRKEVRKARGMPAGMVTLRAYRSLKVRPAPPPATHPGGEGGEAPE